jgi:hypothetical protein
MTKTKNRHDKRDTTKTKPQYIIDKTTSTENKERILKAVKEKNQITYKGKSIKMIADFSTKSLKAREAWD